MGKQFPTIGKTTAEYHVPGTELLGKTIKQDEKIITIDDQLVAHTTIADIDEAMSHFEVRQEYSKQMGLALARTYDRNLLSLMVKAARDTGAGGLGKGAAGFGDAVSSDIGASPTIQDIVAEFYKAAETFDDKVIPESDRWAFVSPATYWALVQNLDLINKQWNGANGSYADGDLKVVAGFRLIKTNNLAIDHTTATDAPDYKNKYAVDASNTVAMLTTSEALGTVKLRDISTAMEFQLNRLSTLMVSRMIVGHGVLRPEGLYEIKKSA